jgi:hypothetical protein
MMSRIVLVMLKLYSNSLFVVCFILVCVAVIALNL